MFKWLLVVTALAQALLLIAAKLVIEKHASELDLGCSSYEEGIDWVLVQKQVKAFVKEPHSQHSFLEDLLALGRSRPQTDCYIGLCSIGYLSLLFMEPERRSRAMAASLFGSVPLHEQIPLSYWDTMASGWPIFGLLEILAAEIRVDQPQQKPPCCEGHGTKLEDSFRAELEDYLKKDKVVPAKVCLQYLASAPSACGWDKASAYFALAESLLSLRTQWALQAAKDVVVLGEFQVDRCLDGRNVTVQEQVFSRWPYWSFLRRIETADYVEVPSSELRLPPHYHAPPPASLRESPLKVEARSSSGAGVGDIVDSCDGRIVHVALAGDKRHAEGLLAAVNSVIKSTASPHLLCIHLFCLEQEESFLQSALRCSFPSYVQRADADKDFLVDHAILRIHTFRAEEVTAGFPVQAGVVAEAGDLNTPHNFIRFRLGQWWPRNITLAIYLDTDVIVRSDVCELHAEAVEKLMQTDNLLREPVVAAVPRRHLPLAVYLRAYSPRMPVWLPSLAPSFNAGVMVINLQAWEQANVTARVMEMAAQNKDRALWRHGSQPPLLLLLHDRVQWLHSSWNVDGLGHSKEHAPGEVESARIWHWTGPLKPWYANGHHQDLWTPYAVHCWQHQTTVVQEPVDGDEETSLPTTFTASSNF